MTNPVFFTENQAGRKSTLPAEWPGKCTNHHQSRIRRLEDGREGWLTGHHQRLHYYASCTGITKFFYVNYCNAHPTEVVDKSLFQYPGPNPFTREQAILMMADTVEAASRSMHEYTEESISNLVNKLIDGQVADGFFKECPITFRDIALAKTGSYRTFEGNLPHSHLLSSFKWRCQECNNSQGIENAM